MAAVKDKDVRPGEQRGRDTQDPPVKDTPTPEKRENRIVTSYREIRSEMRKVVWPTRQETARLTGVVIAVSAVASVILGFADFIFTFLYQALYSAFGS